MKLFQGRLKLSFACSCFYFRSGSKLRHLLHLLKYGDRPQVGYWLGMICAAEIRSCIAIQSFDFIIPVPLHTRRLKERGYNQATCIARGVCRHTGILLLENILVRAVYTKQQVKTHSREERLNNLSGAFSVTQPALLKNKHVLLVDDVLTTGATIVACATPLTAIAGIRISVLTAGISSGY